MDNEIRISKDGPLWKCELWNLNIVHGIPGYYFIDNVSANSFAQLIIEIGNKNWIDLLNK